MLCLYVTQVWRWHGGDTAAEQGEGQRTRAAAALNVVADQQELESILSPPYPEGHSPTAQRHEAT